MVNWLYINLKKKKRNNACKVLVIVPGTWKDLKKTLSVAVIIHSITQCPLPHQQHPPSHLPRDTVPSGYSEVHSRSWNSCVPWGFFLFQLLSVIMPPAESGSGRLFPLESKWVLKKMPLSVQRKLGRNTPGWSHQEHRLCRDLGHLG